MKFNGSNIKKIEELELNVSKYEERIYTNLNK